MDIEYGESSSLASLSIPLPPPLPIFALSDAYTTRFTPHQQTSSAVIPIINEIREFDFSCNPIELSLQNAEKISIKKCPNIQNALKMFEQPWLVCILNKQSATFLIKFEIEASEDSVKFSKIVDIFENLERKFLIILFEHSDKNYQIFWRFGSEKILTINFDKEISKFLLNFLSSSMKRDGHSGISLDTLSILNSNEEICQLDLFSLADVRDFNLLMLAAEHGDENAVNFLLKQGFDVNILIINKTAVDLAWENQHFDIVLLLLKANSVFPTKFNFKEATDELKSFANLAQKLHIYINEKKIEEAEEILEQNPNLRYFYITENISAAAKAAKCGDFGIYDLLMSYNVFIGPKENLNKILQDLDEGHRENMRGINLKYIQNWTDKHLMILTANSFVGHDVPDVDKKLEHVTKAFEFLDKIHPFASLILKVVAASRDFKIIFDFKRDSVQYLDPSAERHTRGVYHTSRHIYVAAQHLFDPNRKLEAYGTLIHELCHYAVHLVYHNNCRPYYRKDDAETFERFKAISFLCKMRSHNELLIGMVYNNYNPDSEHAELIVRVPHMIVEYSNDEEKLSEKQQNFPELFNFYEKITAVDMEKSLPQIEIEAEAEIQKFAHRTEKQEQQIFSLWVFSLFMLLSMPFLIWLTWWLVMVPIEPIYTCGNLTDELRMKIFNSTVDFQGANVIFSDLFGTNTTSCDVLSIDEIRNMLNVFDANEYVDGNAATVDVQKLEFMDLKLERFGGLDRSSVNFSIDRYDSNEEHGNYDEIRNGIMDPIENPKLKEEKIYSAYKTHKFRVPSLKIGEKVVLKSKIYVERKISVAYEFGGKYYHYQKDFNNLMNEKLVIFSNGPGSGKSTTFRRTTLKLKEIYPLRWVSFIDLKLHIQAIKQFPKYSTTSEVNTIKVAKFLADNIFNLTSKADLKVFNEKFATSQTIFLWDGLDEVSPYCLNEILNLFEIIHKFTNNFQWISTRPSFKKDILNKFHVSEHNLAPYDEHNREEFITKFFESKNFSTENITAAKQRIDAFTQRFEKQGTYDFYAVEMVKSPLMLDMICKSYSQQFSLDNSTNLYSFFDYYVYQLFDAVQHEKGEVVTNDTKRIEKQEMFREIHQYFAMKDFVRGFIVSDIFNADHQFIDNQKHLGILRLNLKWKIDEISRYGILFPDPSGKLVFDHRTLYEFFIAQYFYDNVWNLMYGRVSLSEARWRLLTLFSLIRKGKESFKVILDFISGFVETYKSDADDSFNEEISYLMQYEYKDLLRSVHTDFERIEYFTKFFNKDRKVLEILWKIGNGRTFFHEFIHDHSEIEEINSMVKVVRRNFNSEDEKKIFEGESQVVNFLFLLNGKSKEYIEIFENITNFEYDCDKLSGVKSMQEFINFIEPQNFSTSEYREFIFAHFFEVTTDSNNLIELEAFWKFAERKLTKSDMKIVLQQKEYYSNQTLIFQMHNKDTAIVKFILNLIEKYLDRTEIVNLLMQRKRLNKDTFLSYFSHMLENPKSLEEIWVFMGKYMSREEKRIMLTSNTKDETFHKVCLGDRIDTFQFYKRIFLEVFSVDEIRQMVMKSVRDIIFSIVTTMGYEVEVPNAIAKFFDEIFKNHPEELRELLSAKDKTFNLTVFKMHSKDVLGSNDKLQPFMDLAKKVFREDELKALYE